MNRVLRNCLDIYCIAYLGNIAVNSNTQEEHTRHVRAVLERLHDAGLYLKLSKREFNAQRVGFVGFIVTADGVEMELDCIQTITKWPMPASYRDIEVFLGFANFYHQFIENFLKIKKHMTDMLKGGKYGSLPGPFQKMPEMECAFRRLQQAFTTAPVLVHFDPDKLIRLETDLSGFAIAGILSQLANQSTPADSAGSQRGNRKVAQDWRPFAFWSRTMQPAECNYTVRDQEMLVIVMSCRHWRHYLEGSR